MTGAEERADPVRGTPLTLIRWSDGLTGEHDLTRTEIAGNLLVAVHGRLTDEVFAIPGEAVPPGLPQATVRADHSDGPPHCLHTLTQSLAWQRVPAARRRPADAAARAHRA